MEVPHRADVAIKAWSAELVGLFVQTARGLYALMGAEKSLGDQITRTIKLDEVDRQTLLIRFLNELIYDVQIRSVIYEVFNVQIQQNSLYGELKGRKTAGFVREIKAATYHECKILRTTKGYETVVVFDI